MNWILILLIATALLGCVIWIWRVWQNSFAGRMSDYDSREMVFLAEVQAVMGDPKTTEQANPAQAQPAIVAQQPVAAAATTAKSATERPPALLDDAGKVIYKDLQACVGDYPLTVGVDIARLITDPHATPPRVQADYVVCRRDFTPVVAIFLDRGQSDPLRERALQLLKQGRLRVLRWDIKAPPASEVMRQQIFKSKASAEA